MTISQNENNTILVVDDNPDNLRLLAGILSEHHYKVRLAPNGERALATIRKELPGLILLDIMMPVVDGFEVCRQLKIESYISNHSEAKFSHGCCDECAKKLYPELLDKK